MTNTFKIFAIGCLSLLLAAGCERQESVTESQLPAASQTFLQQHFTGIAVAYATFQVDGLEKKYEVRLANGVEVDFFKNGDWKDVDCGNVQPVPTAIIPTPIATYITTHYPAAYISQIQRETMHLDHYRYEVELNNGLDLFFKNDGSFLRIDD